ncbi:MAG: hypothetical protein KBG73_10930 [Candidatus Promineofilum sp.]|nr:hypothetical protein [Promineifilum sp.]
MTVNTMPAARLMVSGPLQLDGAPEARRGMVVLDAAGDAAGTLAGVLIDGATGRPTHLVLCRDPAAGDYRLVAVGQVTGLDAPAVRLRLTPGEVAELPHHNPD